MPRYRLPKSHERGFAILLAAGIIAMLTASALVLVSQALAHMQVVGGMQNTARARMIADAGGVSGAQKLEDLAYPGGPNGGLTLTSLRQLPPVQNGDLVCADLVPPCSAYRLLTSATAFGGGTYTVAVTCNPGACNTAPSEVVNFQIRSLGTMPGGAHKLIEITLEPHG